MDARELTELIEHTVHLANLVHAGGPISLDGVVDDAVFGRHAAEALGLLWAGVDADTARRRFAQAASAERARYDERVAVLSLALELIADGERGSHIEHALRTAGSSGA